MNENNSVNGSYFQVKYPSIKLKQCQSNNNGICPKQHYLQKHNLQNIQLHEIICDNCNTMKRDGTNIFIYRCQKCNYDLCQKCYEQGIIYPSALSFIFIFLFFIFLFFILLNNSCFFMIYCF